MTGLSLRVTYLAWPGACPGLARRSHRLAATVTGGPPLQLTVRYQGRRYRAQIHDPAPARPGAARTGTSPTPQPASALVAWPGASTGSAGIGPPGPSARPSEHGGNPADCPQDGVT
jgi:hypothetical protein